MGFDPGNPASVVWHNSGNSILWAGGFFLAGRVDPVRRILCLPLLQRSIPRIVKPPLDLTKNGDALGSVPVFVVPCPHQYFLVILHSLNENGLHLFLSVIPS